LELKKVKVGNKNKGDSSGNKDGEGIVIDVSTLERGEESRDTRNSKGNAMRTKGFDKASIKNFIGNIMTSFKDRFNKLELIDRVKVSCIIKAGLDKFTKERGFKEEDKGGSKVVKSHSGGSPNKGEEDRGSFNDRRNKFSF
jgi:hypothetical protein